MNRIMRAAAPGLRQAWLWRNRAAFGGGGSTGEPRLLVDISVIMRNDARTGIQRVVRAVWSELSQRSGRGFEVLPVFATSRHGYCYAPLDFLDRKGGRLTSEPVSARPGDKFLGLDLAAHLLPKYRRQLRAWRANGATLHLVVYDLLPLLQPHWFSRAASAHFRSWFDTLVEVADQAICISDHVVRDLQQRLGDNLHRMAIGRLRLGGDIAASMPSEGLPEEISHLLERMRFRPAILMVGTVEPRKGYEVALAAFEHLWRNCPTEAPDLVIVGKGGWKTDGLQHRLRSHPEHGKRLHWLDEVSDEALCEFYASCRGLLVSSHAEGFGLPLVEAAMYGRPILARDLPVFLEQRLPNTSYFNDDRQEPLGARLLALAAQTQGPSATRGSLPTWFDCVSGLLNEIGINGQCGSPELLLRAAQ